MNLTNKKRIFTLMLSLLSFCGLKADTEKRVVLWDLGFTLLDQSWMERIKAIGLITGTRLAISLGSKVSNTMKDSLYGVLDRGEFDHDGTCDTWTPLDPSGAAMPVIMQRWHAGNITSAEIKTVLDQKLENFNGYKSEAHRAALTNVLTWMFTPEVYARSWVINSKAFTLLRECTASENTTLGILSNFDVQTFDYFKKTTDFAKISGYVQKEDMFVSGYMRDMKPHPSFFLKVLKKLNIQAKQCILIDDQEENCKAARAMGMQAVLWQKNKNVAEVRQELIKFGAIKSK